MLTPFERNLEVWRQLWRTLERSDLIVQIVDARNPLGFRSQDLSKYVLELNEPRHEPKNEPKHEDDLGEGPSAAPERRNLLLINKSDLLTRSQRSVPNRAELQGILADNLHPAGSDGQTTLRRKAFSTPSSPQPTASRCKKSAHDRKRLRLSRQPPRKRTATPRRSRA